MIRTLLVIALILLAGCASSSEPYESPYAGSQTIGTRSGSSGLKPPEQHRSEEMLENAERINRRKQGR